MAFDYTLKPGQRNPFQPPTQPSVPAKSDWKLVRKILLAFVTFCLVSLLLAAGILFIKVTHTALWHAQLARLLQRSWDSLTRSISSNTLGFIMEYTVLPIVVVPGAFCAYFILRERHDFWKSVAESSAVAAFTAVALICLWGAVFGWNVVKTVYDDHQVLVSQRDSATSNTTSVEPITQSDQQRIAAIKDNLATFMTEFDPLWDCMKKHQEQDWAKRFPQQQPPPSPTITQSPEEWNDCERKRTALDRKVEEYLRSNLDPYYLTMFKRDEGGWFEGGTLRNFIEKGDLKPLSDESRDQVRRAMIREQLGNLLDEGSKFRSSGGCGNPIYDPAGPWANWNVKVERYLSANAHDELGRFKSSENAGLICYQAMGNELDMLNQIFRDFQ